MQKSIKTWAEDDRPREKMLLKGANAMSNTELLAIILGSGSRNASAVDLARNILNECNNDLNELAQKTIPELKLFKGVGEAKALSVSATIELARRKIISRSSAKSQLRCSAECYVHLRPFFANLSHEEFYVVYLNRALRVINTEQAFKGGMSGTVVDGKIIFRRALQLKATSVVLAHNHPSGQLFPSEADKKLTSQLKQFGAFIDIQILDHLIITADNYFSFADEAML